MTTPFAVKTVRMISLQNKVEIDHREMTVGCYEFFIRIVYRHGLSNFHESTGPIVCKETEKKNRLSRSIKKIIFFRLCANVHYSFVCLFRWNF